MKNDDTGDFERLAADTAEQTEINREKEKSMK